MRTRLYYFYDPMCSWCWAFAPVLAELRALLGEEVEFHTRLGGLAPDSDKPMPMALRHRIEDTWRTIQERVPGTEFNFNFWTQCQPRRSTYPACRAVIAARLQGADYAQQINAAIQRGYYLRAMNPSDIAVLASLAAECGLDAQQLEKDIQSPAVEDALMQEILFCRKLGVEWYPSLVLDIDGQKRHIAVDYLSAGTMGDAIQYAIS